MHLCIFITCIFIHLYNWNWKHCHYLFDEHPSSPLKGVQNGFIDLGLICSIDYNFVFVKWEFNLWQEMSISVWKILWPFPMSTGMYSGICTALVLIFDLLSTYSMASCKSSHFYLSLPLKSGNHDNEPFYAHNFTEEKCTNVIINVMPLTK